MCLLQISLGLVDVTALQATEFPDFIGFEITFRIFIHDIGILESFCRPKA